jgi:putative transposase
VTAFVDSRRGDFGVEPICRVLGVSASAYYQRATGRRSRRSLEDERLLARIRELHAANYYAYGSRRMWIALRRAGEPVARCTVERLMRAHGIQGAKRRGKPWRTTRPDPAARRRPDLVERDFTATGPNRLWVADITYLRCWEGVVFFAFVLDAYSRPHRRLAARRPHAHHAGLRRVADGAASARSRRRRAARPPLRSRLARRIQAVVATPDE